MSCSQELGPRQLQTNKGICVTAIVDGSPAYDSDVLIGDVIVAMNGEAASGVERFMELIQVNRGKAARIDVIRGSERITKSVLIAN